MKNKLVLSTCILILLGNLLACDGVEGRKQKYLEQAEASFAQGDFEKARINFKNVLQIDPKDLKGREGFARTLEKLQDWRGAVSQYRAVVEQDPANASAKIKLGQLYLLAKAADLAMPLADEILSGNALHDGALALKAGAQVQQGKLEEALVNAEQAYKLNNQSIDNIILLASIYRLSQRAEDAIALLEKAVESHPESNAIHTLLAQIYMTSGRVALAEKSLRKLVDINPEAVGFKSQLARFYEANGRGEEAERLLIDAVKQAPDQVDTVAALQGFYLQRGDAVKAEAVIKDTIQHYPERADFQLRLAGFYVTQSRKDEARAIYTRLLEDDSSTALKARNRLAYLATLDNDVEGAFSLVNAVLQENPGDVEALTIRGGLYLGQRNAVAAINDLRTVLNANPDSVDIIKMLGRAHRLNGETQQSIDMFKAALNLQPRDVEVRLQLADLLLKTREVNQAAKQLEIADQQVPDNQLVLEKLVSVYIQGQYLDDAEKIVERLNAINPKNPRNAYYRGIIAQGREQHGLAMAAFDESLTLKPGAIEPMTAKVKSYIALKQIDAAITWLDSIMPTMEKNPVAHNLQGELWLAKKEWKQARAAFDRAIALKSDWWIPYRNAALAISASGSSKDAYVYLLEAVDKANSPPLRIELANYAEQQQAYDVAIEQYESVLSDAPDNKVIVNNLTMLLITHKTDQASLARASELASLLEGQENPLFLDTVGWVHFVKGDYQKALPIIQQAARAAPEDPSIQYHLAMVYLETNDKQNAERYLKRALENDKSFSGRDKARRLLDEISQQG